MLEKIIAGITTGANLLFLIGLFISLKYWNEDWMKKVRKFYSKNYNLWVSWRAKTL